MIYQETLEVRELRNLIESKRRRVDFLREQASSAADSVAAELELLERVQLQLEACTCPFHTEITEMVNRKVDQMLRQPYARKLDAMVFYFHLREPQGPMYYAGYGSNVGYLHSELRLEAYFGGRVHIAKIVPLDILDDIELRDIEIKEIEKK